MIEQDFYDSLGGLAVPERDAFVLLPTTLQDFCEVWAKIFRISAYQFVGAQVNCLCSLRAIT